MTQEGSFIKSLNDAVLKKSEELISKYEKSTGIVLENIKRQNDFSEIINRCCENILGFLKIPLGITHNPVIINKKEFFIPVCTTEGALVASLCRGVKLVNACGGVNGVVENLGITRSFAIEFLSFNDAIEFYKKLKKKEYIKTLKKIGNDTSRFLKISKIESKHVIGCLIYIKVYAYTGDAMGMNMVTKACNAISEKITEEFKGSKLACISANICTDKKWSMENYVNGRGRRVFLNLEIKNEDCLRILKVSIFELYKLYQVKITIGSALAMASFNCQASNYVAGIFIALGQDVAQVIESSNCMITMEIKNDILYVSLWMPSIVCGVIGGGTHLKPQNNFLQQFYLEDSDNFITDKILDKSIAPNYLALTVATAVLCGELSCMASMADNSLMNAHLKLNRK
ncbi:hypothetical protein GVAV_000391 [Gurleya vavrai]